MSSARGAVFEANMHAAMRAVHDRGAVELREVAIVDMPFDEMLKNEREGDDLEGEPGEYEWRQRILGAQIVFRWILAEGFNPLKMMKRLFAIGRALRLEPFTQMTMNEQGLMFSETKAAVSWRMKLLSGAIKLRGMAGHRLPGQKTERAVEASRLAALGNHNRTSGGGSGAGRPVNGHKPRQGSFLRKLRVAQEGRKE